MRYLGVRPMVDGKPFIIDSAAHKFAKAGYTTSIDAKAKSEK
jgi:hypothetical protein